jgi:transcriptional regulator with XRE-family HTH domain
VSTKTLSEPRKFSERLAWLRAQTGLTQDEFGRRCKVTKGYISRLESGERENPSDGFLRNCCDAFQVPVEWLENGKGQLPEVDPETSARPAAPAGADPGPGAEASLAVTPGELTEIMRAVMEAVTMDSQAVLRVTGLLMESPELRDGLKRATVVAATQAFNERDMKRLKAES